MLTATTLGTPLGVGVEDLIPVIVGASSAFTKAVDQMSAVGVEIKSAINQISELPNAFISKAEGATESMGHAAGVGFAKGFGWNVLPPLAVGTGIVIGGLLLYSLAMRRIDAEPQPALGRPYTRRKHRR